MMSHLGVFMNAEPFRVKMVEEIELLPKEERQRLIKDAGFNVFQLKIDDIYIDLLTDSGTSAMSDKQWAAMLMTKQAYAGSDSYYMLEKVVRDVFGFRFFVPVHQGRAGEHILFSNVVKPGNVVPNNSHFDTTHANIKFVGGIPQDFVIEDAYDTERRAPFKGNVDIEKLEDFAKKNKDNIPLIMTTITNNTVGGQPVSMENIRETGRVARKYNIPFFIDACRFAENCYFIKTREKGYENKTIKEIAGEIFSYADGCTFSGKKDALTNIGGILATNDEELFEKIKSMLVITEGFLTYGGLACRELAAMAVGLEESTQERYLEYQCGQAQYLWEELRDAGIPTVNPAGGHAVFVDGKRFFPNIPQEQFPSQTLAVELYIESGVRGVEVGTSCFGEVDKKIGRTILPKLDLLRLSIPRRVYTNNHLDYVAKSIIRIYERRKETRGLKRVYAPSLLGHFLAKFEQLS
jgi:tryptophanase